MPTNATTTVTSQPMGTIGHLQQIWSYRELLSGLVRKELKVKYKNSSLGFIWSMLNPALYLVVFYLVFQVFLRSGIPRFPIYLLSGLLVWNFFSGALGAATGAITGNSSLVNKVYFPREILPLASVGATLVHFFLQALVLIGALLVFRQPIPWSYLWLVIPALAVLVLLASAICILLSAVNVYARDTQHLLELVLLAWFWLTPIVYHYRLVADRLTGRGWPEALMLLNPVVAITTSFQRAIYGTVSTDELDILPPYDQWWYLRNLALVGLFAAALFVVALRVFDRLQGNFAEEL
jgi:ABC-2 type transport system permease protein